MRITNVPGLVLLAGLAGMMLVACNLLLGRGYGSFNATGGGSSTSSGTNGGDAGGTDGDAADAGVGRGIWSTSFAASTVAAIAVDANSNVFITGRASGPTAFTCPVPDAGDAGAETGTGYLVELDSQGVCQWGFFFGDDAQGTGVAVDGMGNVALTGSFSGTSYIAADWPPATTGGHTNSFIAVFDQNRTLTWAAEIGDEANSATPGDQITTGVALNGGSLAVSGSYTQSLGVSFQSSSTVVKPIATTTDPQDAFVIPFMVDGGLSGPMTITSPSTGFPVVANGIALDSGGNVAAIGTTAGPTVFNHQMPPVQGAASASMFVTAHVIGVAPDFDLVLGGDLPQDGRCVAFDDADSVLGGGQVGGTVSLLGEGADGGNTFTVTGGKTVLVARYNLIGMPSGWLQFGSDTMGDDATIGGLVPYTGDAGASVAFAGGFQGTAAFPGGQSITNPDTISAVYVAKVDGALSTVLWLERYGDGMANQVADAVAVDPSNGSILVAGHFQGTLDFGIPDGGLVNMTGTDQLFVAKLAP